MMTELTETRHDTLSASPNSSQEESGLATWVFSSTDSGESEKKEVEDLNENFESVMERPCAPTDITSHLFAAAVYDYCVSGMLVRPSSRQSRPSMIGQLGCVISHASWFHRALTASLFHHVPALQGRVAAGVRVWEGHVTEAMLAFSFGTLREQFGEGTKVKYEQSLEAQLERRAPGQMPARLLATDRDTAVSRCARMCADVHRSLTRSV